MRVLFTVTIFLLPIIALGATSSGGNTLPTSSGGNTLPTSYGGNTANSGDNCDPRVQVCNPLQFHSICGLVTGVLDAIMVIGIPIAIMFVVWAGFKFVVAQGNPESISQAKTNFLHVIIGIAIFVGASLIAHVIMQTIENLGVTGISSCQ